MVDPVNKKHENDIHYINLYESEDKVYVRKISGLYQSIRRYTGIPLLLGFFLLPWLTIDGRPAVYFDLPHREFNILWTTFGPQDGMLLAWLLIISAFALFTVTSLLGRVWCGFTCPQTVWTLMFIWAERICEGERSQRIKLDKKKWSVEKVLRKSGKFTLWFLMAFATGATFIAYFYPIQDLLLGFVPVINDAGFPVFSGNLIVIFWTLLFTVLTFMNAGFLREQVCKYMCPYARFQSVMYDNDTLAVHYDSHRGERRGSRKQGDDYKAKGLGDCIDCSWCVQVCPVDIDIRDGIQYECINCGLCVDACDSIMDKMDYPKGLIRFTSEEGLKHGVVHYFRPRVIGYSLVLAVMIALFCYVVVARNPVTLDVDRDRGAQMYVVRKGMVQNTYKLKVHNMTHDKQKFDVKVEGDYPFKVMPYRAMSIDVNEIFSFPIRIEVDQKQLKSVKSDITFTVVSRSDNTIFARETSSFIGPDKQ